MLKYTMTVKDVYLKFSTPKNLQEHMLRVAALSKIITDNWTGPTLNSLPIVKTCALHDTAKPMTFDINKQAAYGATPDEITKLSDLQNLIKSKYGLVEHEAVIEMYKDLNMEENCIRLIKNFEWIYIPRLVGENDYESLICNYCDMRIGPKGILGLQQRLDDLKVRMGGEQYEEDTKNGKLVEPLIMENTNIDLNSITDDDLNSLFPEILSLSI
jgi:hypothetical protein